MAKSSIQKTFFMPAALLDHIEGVGGSGHTFTHTVCAALLHFFADPDERERQLWFRAMQLVKKRKLDWRQASSWVAEHRVEEVAA